MYMEKRNIQKTGGASFTVTLPKQWVDRFGLEDKDPVELTIQPSGALLIQPEKNRKKLPKITCEADELTPEELAREIISSYLAGADEITIKGKRLEQPQRTQIRQVAKSLMGLEIIDESSTQITIRNIFDISRLSIPQNIEKMFFITQSMFADAMKALSTKDLVLAQDVIDRDLEIDKFHFLIIRQFHSLISGKLMEEDIGISLLDCNYYSFTAMQIERIADHAVKISRAIVQMKVSSPKSNTLKVFEKDTQQVLTLLKQSASMVQTLNKKMAHTILDEFEAKEKLSNAKPAASVAVEPIIADSLDRVQRYILNIAEMTIDQLAMK